jgi:hypothetical protein
MFKRVLKVAVKYKELFKLNKLKPLSVFYFYLALFIYFIYINKRDNLKNIIIRLKLTN